MYFLGWVHCNFCSNIELAEIFAHLNFLTIKSGQRRSYTSSKKTLHGGGASCVSCHHPLFQQILYCISLNRLKTQHIFGHDVMVISRLLISVSCWQSTRLAAGGLAAGWAGPFAMLFLVHSSSNLNEKWLQKITSGALPFSQLRTWDKTTIRQTVGCGKNHKTPRYHPWIYWRVQQKSPVSPAINPSDHLSSRSLEVCIWNQL